MENTLKKENSQPTPNNITRSRPKRPEETIRFAPRPLPGQQRLYFDFETNEVKREDE
jgi:hypothetical protein